MLEGLLQIAKNWQRSNDVNKNLEATSEARKATNSSCQKNKADKWQSKATSDPNAGGKPADSKAKCGYCGLAEHNDCKKQCKAYGQQCKKCNKMNHFQSVCLSNSFPRFGDKTNRVGCINMVCKRARVQDDSEQTPLMNDVKFKANKGLGKTTTLDVFPGTDCQQTLVAEDLISASGLVLDQTKKKKIKSVDGNRVPCSGPTSF